MSRTFRNRPNRLISSNEDALYFLDYFSIEIVERMIWKHYADSMSGDWNLPKHFRKHKNTQRKTIDKRELHRIMGDIEYIPNMSTWNCKDARILDWF